MNIKKAFYVYQRGWIWRLGIRTQSPAFFRPPYISLHPSGDEKTMEMVFLVENCAYSL